MFPHLLLFLQVMRINMTVNTVRHLLMHDRRMRLTMAGLTLRHAGMRSPMTEGTGECLMLGGCLGHQFTDPIMTRHAESPRCCQCVGNLQRMMGRVAGQTIIHGLTLGMRFMALETLRNLTMGIMAEGT